ncbi:HesB/IscA family protein [Shumkonia mesophila]|uniref:HesB/IscA family protein n=1 Tax=Shumkonia mesophila TaxID=2838854 RepID=UPI00293438CE|nr:iron-sulfur cluster assembly accessory protein [Shumkonia mesophila]
MTERPQLLTLTDAAIERVRHLVNRDDASGQALRIGVKAQGCSGMSYHVEFAAAPGPADEVVEAGGVTVYVDPKATLYLLGSRMDYVEDKLKSGFVFSNPNEKARCGCGESFHV